MFQSLLLGQLLPGFGGRSLSWGCHLLLQEWAAQNQVVVPHKEGRVNASQLYKGGDEDAPTNILQVQAGPLGLCRRACRLSTVSR